MKTFFRNYKSTAILLAAIIIGGIAGVVAGSKAEVVKPFGDLFLNLMFTVIIPLVFFSISSAIANMAGLGRLGKILGSIILVFLGTSLLAAIIGFGVTFIIKPLAHTDTTAIEQMMAKADGSRQSGTNPSFLEQLVQTFTVPDFPNLFTKTNMLQLIVFSVLFGLATTLAGEKGKPVAAFLASGTAVMMKFVKIIMYYAPIGLGCYFASIIGTLGPQILEGYARSFGLYLILTVIYFFGFFTLYAFMAGGGRGDQSFLEKCGPPFCYGYCYLFKCCLHSG